MIATRKKAKTAMHKPKRVKTMWAVVNKRGAILEIDNGPAICTQKRWADLICIPGKGEKVIRVGIVKL